MDGQEYSEPVGDVSVAEILAVLLRRRQVIALFTAGVTAIQHAQYLVQTGKNRLLGEPTLVEKARGTGSKVLVVSLLSLFFSCGTILVVDWMRKGVCHA